MRHSGVENGLRLARWAAASILLLSCAVPSWAGGQLDSGFANGERGPTGLSSIRIALAPDGRIALGGTSVAGSLGTVRVPAVLSFDARGMADTGFGEQGVLQPAPDSIAFEDLGDLVFDRRGRLIAGGVSGVSGDGMWLTRFLIDGAPSPAFRPAVTDAASAVPLRSALSMALAGDGIFVGGSSLNDSRSRSFAEGERRAIVARVLADGGFDPGFGQGGATLLDAGEEAATAWVAADPQGGVLAVSTFNGDLPGTECRVRRLDATGTPVASAFPGGVLAFESCRAVRQDAAGRVVVLLPGELRRYDEGMPDATFGNNGSVAVGTEFTALALGRDDAVFLAGTAWQSGQASATLRVRRYDASGRPDPTYGVGGVGQVNFTAQGGVGEGPVLAVDTLDRAVIALVAFGPLTDFGVPPTWNLHLYRFTGRAGGARLRVTEYFNSVLQHYFMTADPLEAAYIDAGGAGPGWQRTGEDFDAWADLGGLGNRAVCRWYGSMWPGPNSHFFSSQPGECNTLLGLEETVPSSQPRWNFEAYSFVVREPDPGAEPEPSCPVNTRPIYRAYNDGFARGKDSNHRYVADRSLLAPLVADGWLDEGVVFCVPQ